MDRPVEKDFALQNKRDGEFYAGTDTFAFLRDQMPGVRSLRQEAERQQMYAVDHKTRHLRRNDTGENGTNSHQIWMRLRSLETGPTERRYQETVRKTSFD